MQNNDKTKTGNRNRCNLKKKLITAIAGSEKKLTPRDLEKKISENFKIERKLVKSAIKELVAENEVIYTYHFGNTFIEISYNKPVRISNTVVIKPQGIHYEPKPHDIVIDLLPGVSFGTGQHPSTRLAVRGIEYALKKSGFVFKNSTALDIGTGTGILLIASILFGVNRGEGIDIDACAIKEAKNNIKINGFEKKIEIYEKAAENISGSYSLITANLRYPTIKRLCPIVNKISIKNSILVVSGIKRNEVNDIVLSYGKNRFNCLLSESENDWASAVLKRSV